MNRTVRPVRQGRPLGPRAMLASMALVEVASGATQQYLPPILPGLGAQAGFGTAQQNWIIVVQMASCAVLTPVLSRLGDGFGYRRLLRASILMVVLGSLVMALRPTLPFLTLGAALQGGVVGFMPLMIGVLRHQQGEAASRRGIGVLVGALLLAVGCAGIVSGAVGAQDARLGLWIGVGAGVLGLVAGFLLPDGATPAAAARRFDVPGFLLLTAGLVGVVVALAQGAAWGWTSAATVGCGLVGIVALAGWWALELRVAQPLVDVRMFRNPRVAVLSVVTFCVSAATIGSIAVNATFLGASPQAAGYGIGLNATAIGWALLPMTLASVATSALCPALLRQLGERVTVSAAGVTTLLGFGFLLVLHTSLAHYLIASLFIGAALGLFESATRTLTVEAVAPEETATAAGVNELVLSLGSAVGSALLGAALAAHATADGRIALGGYTTGWALCGAAGLAAALAVLKLRPAASSAPHATAPEGAHQ
ncbi:MFS transporter [Streptomyces sp. NPDC000151]|uniref:MFS transporter n=1 Tax=Streptomyces sp. NPDC000151 TaxID=3154244 RepID=UPI003333109A